MLSSSDTPIISSSASMIWRSTIWEKMEKFQLGVKVKEPEGMKMGDHNYRWKMMLPPSTQSNLRRVSSTWSPTKNSTNASSLHNDTSWSLDPHLRLRSRMGTWARVILATCT